MFKNGKQLVFRKRALYYSSRECHSITVLLLVHILPCILIRITNKHYGKGYQHEAGAHHTAAYEFGFCNGREAEDR